MTKTRNGLIHFIAVMGMIFAVTVCIDRAAFAADTAAPQSPRIVRKSRITKAIREQEARLDWLEEQNRKLVAVVNFLAQENDAKAAQLAKIEEDNEILRDHIRDLERKNPRRRR